MPNESTTTGAGPPPVALSLDQKIAAATITDIQSLQGDIAVIDNNSIRAIYIKALASSLKIPTKTVEADVIAIRQESQGETFDPQTTPSACFSGLVDVALNDGQVGYIVKVPSLLIEGEYYLDFETSHDDGNHVLVPPPRKSLPFTLVQAADVIDCYQKGADKSLFRDTFGYFGQFSFLTVAQNLIITLYTFLTFIQDHPAVHYLAEIYFLGQAERGKSRTGKAFIYIAYRGIYLNGIKEANIFRFSEDLQASLLVDVKDFEAQTKRNNCEDLFLGRLEKGSKVPRVLYPEKGPFSDTRYFDVYGATAIASNRQAGDIFKTRTIPITMAGKPGEYAQPTPALGLPLKTRLTAWRACMMGADLPQVQPIEGVSGRLWDISKSLLQICQQECPEAVHTFHLYIQEVAAERAHDNSSTYEAEIVRVIRDLSPVDVQDWKLLTIAVVNVLNQDRTPEFYSHVGPMGKKLRGMGFSVRTVNGKSVVLLNRQDFDLMLRQYGIEAMPGRKTGTTGLEDPESIVDDILNSLKP